MDEAYRKIVFVFASVLASMCLLGCSCDSAYYDPNASDGRPTKSDFAQYNRQLFWRDSMFISYYSDSLGLTPVPNEDMVWLTVHSVGDGDSLRLGEKVTYAFTVQALTGDTLYSSDVDGPRTVTLGRFEDTEGLDLALRRLRVGAVATVIMTPEKAFHLRGDGKKIRGRCPLRYDVTVLQ